MPDFDLAAQTNNEMASGRREGEGGDRRAERKSVNGDSAEDVGQNGLAIFVNGQ